MWIGFTNLSHFLRHGPKKYKLVRSLVAQQPIGELIRLPAKKAPHDFQGKFPNKVIKSLSEKRNVNINYSNRKYL